MPASQSVDQSDPTVAVIGSGPSGCYTAQFLRKELPNAEITIFEALPVPYGLVRYGVAADHQGTKAVTRQFDRMFERSAVTFVGNTRIGIDVSFEAITSAFDIVVIATGLPSDRQLEIPQDEGAHVIGAGHVLRTLNAFPEEAALANRPLDGELGRDIIVVGQGNVAVDVVRLLTKSSHHLAGSDIDDRALDLLRPNPPRSVRVIGRSPAANAKFDLAMLRELCGIDTITVQVEGLGDSAEGPVVDLLREAVQNNTDADTTGTSDRTLLTFHFESVPTRIRHQDARTVLEVTGASGATDSYAADTVITAIGFGQPDDTRDDIPVAAWSGAHVYRVGWLDRGGRGNIAENRRHAQTVARSIVADLTDGSIPRKGGGGLATVAPQLKSPTVGFDGWQAIDEAERGAADADRCRRKITDLDEMVAIAHSSGRRS